MKISQILNKAVLQLKECNKPSPRLDAEVILANLLEVERLYFILHKDQDIQEDLVEEYKQLIGRRCKGEPVAYIVGHQEFMGLDFIVNKKVLIPRPDTEILVEYVVEYIKQREEDVNILDIGCGSGAIGLSIASQFPKSQVTLVDISPEALELAKENARKLNIKNGQFVLSDCFESISDKYHIIVSNPPYIPAKDIEDLQIEVSTYEPRGALDGGIDGLDFYRRIATEAKEYLLKGSLLAFEIGYNQGNAVIEILKENDYKHVKKLKDLGGNDRIVVGELKTGSKK
ncbi:release factor glutamine methyltransferase [Alkalibaculum bacchi]|jgi:release factor glutamine methyltransferase|uniref:Release factor glutamine methyltransferase n=1 Tax=Alkalibaculum bacchi TaxID=645887 RepID=A0A366I515_9FIRM|nr:peptide chain release factor N(5)-glutamine methyltransferase [Alkalibaculum bacchi]RBP62588.1 release factor glutamine methyltransferase [Alkalibaculum bacchi]